MAIVDPHDDQFLSPRSRYYGQFTPRNLAFNANLQEFSLRVTTICGLETGGKITPFEAYQQLQQLWKQLEESRIALGISGDTSSEE